MSIKNVNVADVAIIELTRTGRTEAPPEVLARLRAAGFIEIDRKGKPSLTGKGAKRAEALKPFEHDLRQQAANAAKGGAALRAIGGTFHG